MMAVTVYAVSSSVHTGRAMSIIPVQPPASVSVRCKAASVSAPNSSKPNKNTKPTSVHYATHRYIFIADGIDSP